MNIRFKVFAAYNILQNLCDYIHVLIFVIVSKSRKSPKLTNIVSLSNEIEAITVANRPKSLHHDTLGVHIGFLTFQPMLDRCIGKYNKWVSMINVHKGIRGSTPWGV